MNASGNYGFEGGEEEEDDNFDETPERQKYTSPETEGGGRLQRAGSVYEGFSSSEGESRAQRMRRVSVYEGFTDDAPEPEVAGTVDAVGNWVPSVEEEEDDSDDEWADTGEAVPTRDASGPSIAALAEGVIDEEDLLISAVDQVTLFGTSLSSESCTKSGWLRKANGWTAVAAQYERSKKRWFELHGDTLYYYRFVPPEAGRGKPLGFVVIGGMEVDVKPARSREIVLTTPKRPYHIYADSPREHASWLNALMQANSRS